MTAARSPELRSVDQYAGTVTTTFADLTTMRVGGPIGRLYVPETTPEVVELLHQVTAVNDPLLVMGGGSNLVVGDVGWDGTVIKMASSDFDIDGERVTAAAGVEWDHLVRATLDEGLAGLEALSGIPGLVGGTPVQNVGAFGTLTSDVLESLSVYDRQAGRLERWTRTAAASAAIGSRSSSTATGGSWWT